MADKPRVLNVGGNNKNIPIPAWYAGFEHLLLDIDASGKPDIVCDARELTRLDGGQFDAVYCSHNLEHFFAHDVPRVLKGFLHVLKASGFAEIRVPDLNQLMETYVEKKMDIEDVLYLSAMGPIKVRDVLYGFGKEIERSGVDFFAHKTGFTFKSLSKALFAAGFECVLKGQGGSYELFVIAFREKPGEVHQNLLGFTMPKSAAPG